MNWRCSALLAVGILTACAAPHPATPAQDAEAASCTAQADAAFNAQNYEALSRTSQNAVRYSATPNHVFDAQTLGAEHVRDSQITDCEENGDTGGPGLPGAAPVTPHIVASP